METDVNGLKADILTSVKGMPLLFYLTHPERRLSLDEAGLHGQSMGVVSIDLTLVPQFLRQASGSKGGYKSELAKFLFDDCSGKQWIYHPRQDGKLLEGNDRLKVLCEESGVKRPRSKAFFSPHKPVIPEELKQPENRQVRYQCVHCNGYEWVGPDRGGDTCPKCQQYLYATRLVGAGIHDGDLLIVDKSLEPRHGSIVIAEVHGELTVKNYTAKTARLPCWRKTPPTGLSRLVKKANW